MIAPLRTVAPPWKTDLEALGFRRSGRAGSYRLDGVYFAFEDGWSVFSAGRREPVDPLRGQLGKAGLWRRVRVGASRRANHVFELPPEAFQDPVASILDSDAESAEDRSALSVLTDWALDTTEGLPPADWQPPALESLSCLGLVQRTPCNTKVFAASKSTARFRACLATGAG